MYSGMRSKSTLYPSYPYHQNHSSDEKSTPAFGDRHYEKFNGYSTAASYPLHQNQNYGFGVNQSSMTNNGTFPYPGLNYHPLQESRTYLVLQPAAALVQEQQAPVKRNAEEEVLVVKVEPSNFPNSKPRLIWTPELQARFIHAAIQLGGLFKATPKAILRIMNVKGLTSDHLKSHLQKMRMKNPNDISTEETMGHGIQNNANSHASQVTEGEASSSSKQNFESNIGQYGQLLRSYETPNYEQTPRIEPDEDLANYFNFEDFNQF